MNINDERIAIVTDLHIGKHQNSTQWHDISLRFAEEFKDKLKSDHIRDIIICGDVNNDRNEINVQSLHIVNELFTIWKDFNINIIVGNHDAYYKNRSDVNSLSILSGWDNINIIDDIEEYNVFGKKMVFVPWGFDINKISNCDYLFGHFEINGFYLNKIKICVNGMDSNNLLQKANTVISGHFHLRDDRTYKNGRIIYLGSPYELDWSDCGTQSRGYYYLTIPTNNIEFIETNSSPKHKKIYLSEITSIGKLTPEIKTEFNGNIISLIIDQDVKDLDKLNDFIKTLYTLNPLSLKTEYILENRVSIDDSNYEFTAVDIKSSIHEFVKMTDYDNKETILNDIDELYEKCKGE